MCLSWLYGYVSYSYECFSFIGYVGKCGCIDMCVNFDWNVLNCRVIYLL